VFDEELRPVTLNVSSSQTQRMRLITIACAFSLSEKLSRFIEQVFCTYKFDSVAGMVA